MQFHDVFCMLNILSLGAIASTLHALTRAQGVGLCIRRSADVSEDGWDAYFRARQKDWKATALTVSLHSCNDTNKLVYCCHRRPSLAQLPLLC